MENSIQYTNRPLTEEEIDILVEEIKHIPGIVYMPRFLLRRISNSVVATCDGEFCGACSNYHIKRDIYKLGPLLVRAKYRKMGIGKELLNRSFKALESKTVYAGTSNPSLWNVLTDNGFVQHPDTITFNCEVLSYHISLNIPVSSVPFGGQTKGSTLSQKRVSTLY